MGLSEPNIGGVVGQGSTGSAAKGVEVVDTKRTTATHCQVDRDKAMSFRKSAS